VAQLQQKLNAAYRSTSNVSAQGQTADRLSGMGMGGIMSKPTMEAYNRAMQSSRRELDQIIQKEARNQEDFAKNIMKRSNELKKLADQQKQMVKDSETELKIRQQIADKEANIYRQREQWAQKDKSLNQMIDARQQLSPSGIGRLVQAYQGGGGQGGGGGIGGVMTAGGRMAMENPMGAMGIAGGVLSGLGTALNFGAMAHNQIANSPFRGRVNMGSAIEGTMGRSIGDMSNPYGQAWMAERARAAQSASAMMENTRTEDRLRLAGGSALMVGGGLTAASGIGILPGLGAMAGGAAAMMGNERMRSLTAGRFMQGTGDAINNSMGGGFGAGNWIKGMGDQQMKEYNSSLAKDFASNFQEQLDAEQKTNPLKKLAAQKYGENWENYLGAQRGMGLGDREFYGEGGFISQAHGAGFTEQQGMGMSSGILGAGGSTRMARDSVFGLQMQRAGLTNASGILGSLSGQMGGSESTKEATIKIMSEAMRIGLDDSKFAEENRQFTQTVAAIVAQSGTKDVGAAAQIAGGFGNFVADNTMGGLKGAAAAYQQYQESSSATAGPQGAMRAAGFMRDPYLADLPMSAKQGLSMLSENELTVDNPQVQAAAYASGKDPQKLIDSIKGVNKNSFSRYGKVDDAMKRLQASGTDPGRRRSADEMKALTQQQQSDIADVYNFMNADKGNLGQEGNISRAHAMFSGVYNPDENGIARDAEQRNKLEEKDTGRMADRTNQNLAESEKLVISSIRAFSSELVPTTENVHKFNQAMVSLANQWNKMGDSFQSKYSNSFSSALGVKTQQTGSNTSGGQ
jgi:hypothetical protein